MQVKQEYERIVYRLLCAYAIYSIMCTLSWVMLQFIYPCEYGQVHLTTIYIIILWAKN